MIEVKEVEEPRRIPIIGSIGGMYTVFKHLFKKPVTVQYPEEKENQGDRFRFRIYLSTDDCVGCTLCEQVCPNLTITMVSLDKENPRNKRKIYPAVNFGTCTVCRNCEEICPTDAIYLKDVFETSRTKNSFFYSPTELEKNEDEVRR
ncbi:MAG: NADH-quinone oxidoreductase subunit NuoI [Candidatus Thermoplasmatota archaeon]|jgi:NADH-quinone oxidoreductase subunit I|nr:NADH-quinone oxidoreductase subunit NuoI [Candidatus Thermoplasmatota archaeon]MCL5790773.1 NADH-quinone oxidoreductase subunit NuoI [Candidatus Thermoplasmatota archaeon]